MNVYDALIDENEKILDELNNFMYHYNEIIEIIKNDVDSNELLKCFMSGMFEKYSDYISKESDNLIASDNPF